ncbi:GtrA family protein [Zoogloea sp.]|uniref:GtrA family protein n=1 Tax=Zoogloea sp. TaxID=49181 RepID=UPI0031FBB006
MRFILVGALNTGVTTLLYWALLAAGLSPALSFGLAFVAGIGLAWWMNGRFTFRTGASARGLVVYPLIYVPPWAVGQGLLSLLLDAGVPGWLAGPLASLGVVPLSFGLNRFFFRGRQAPTRS